MSILSYKRLERAVFSPLPQLRDGDIVGVELLERRNTAFVLRFRFEISLRSFVPSLSWQIKGTSNVQKRISES
jgi:hypothetical protein